MKSPSFVFKSCGYRRQSLKIKKTAPVRGHRGRQQYSDATGDSAGRPHCINRLRQRKSFPLFLKGYVRAFFLAIRGYLAPSSADGMAHTRCELDR
jgi:hypothetical protein